MLNQKIKFVLAIFFSGFIREYLQRHLAISEAPLGWSPLAQPISMHSTNERLLNCLQYLIAPLGAPLGAALLYYFAGHLINTKSKIIRALILSAVVLILQGGLQNSMDSMLYTTMLFPYNILVPLLSLLLLTYPTVFVMSLIIVLCIEPKPRVCKEM